MPPVKPPNRASDPLTVLTRSAQQAKQEKEVGKHEDLTIRLPKGERVESLSEGYPESPHEEVEVKGNIKGVAQPYWITKLLTFCILRDFSRYALTKGLVPIRP